MIPILPRIFRGPAAAGLLVLAGMATPPCAQAADQVEDAVGVPNADGSVTAYGDPFCAGFASAFVAGGGDKALTPECPEEPTEPLSLPPYRKGVRAGQAAAQAYAQFSKQRISNTDRLRLPGFYDKSRDRWVGNAPGLPPSIAFEGNRYAVIAKEDAGMGVIDQTGAIVVPFEYQQIDVQQTDDLEQKIAPFFSVRNTADKIGLYDLRGALVVPVEYDEIRFLDDTHIRALRGGIFYLMDLRGKTLFSSSKEITPAGEGLFWFMDRPQRFGLMDQQGKVVVPAEFTYTSAFKKGALVSQKSDGEDYVIHRDGRVAKRR